MTVKELSLMSIFTALYAVAVIALAPISFSIFQVRIADALLPLAIIFGWPVIIGVTIGAVVANFFGGLGVIDIAGGAVANFLATLLAWKIGRKRMKRSWIYAIVVEVLTVTLIVGSYLSYLLGIVIWAGISGVLIGSIIAIGALGYLLLTAIARPLVIELLNSYGIKLYLEKKDSR